MNGIVRLYDRFKQWTEQLSQMQYAILVGLEVFVLWVGLGLLFGGDLFIAVFGALGATMAYYYLDPR